MIVSIATYVHAGALYSHLAVYHVVNSASATQELNFHGDKLEIGCTPDRSGRILEAIAALIRYGTETRGTGPDKSAIPRARTIGDVISGRAHTELIPITTNYFSTLVNSKKPGGLEVAEHGRNI